MSDSAFRVNRREILNLAAAAGAVSGFAPLSAQSDDATMPSPRVVDTNVSLFQWPFRRLPLDDVDVLVTRLQSLGIAQAWAGSFEGVLHRDVAAVNLRLTDACSRYPELIPIGTLNPALPDWGEDLRRCVEEHGMPGVRLHPNYHGYKLNDSRFARLLERATEAGRFVQIAAAMEDVRTQHELVRVNDADLTPLPERRQCRPGRAGADSQLSPQAPAAGRSGKYSGTVLRHRAGGVDRRPADPDAECAG